MTDSIQTASGFGSSDKPLRRYIRLYKALQRIFHHEQPKRGPKTIQEQLIATWGAAQLPRLLSLSINYSWRGRTETLSRGQPDNELGAVAQTLLFEQNVPSFQEKGDVLLIRTQLPVVPTLQLAVALRQQHAWSNQDIGWVGDSIDLLKDMASIAQERELDKIAHRITHRQNALKELRPNSRYYNLCSELEHLVAHNHGSILISYSGASAAVVAETIRYPEPRQSDDIGRSFELSLQIQQVLGRLAGSIELDLNSAELEPVYSQLCHVVYEGGEKLLGSVLLVSFEHSKGTGHLLMLADRRSRFFTADLCPAIEYIVKRTAPIFYFLHSTLLLEEMSKSHDNAVRHSRSQVELLENAKNWFGEAFGASAVHIHLPKDLFSSVAGDDLEYPAPEHSNDIPKEFLDALVKTGRAIFRGSIEKPASPAFKALLGAPFRLTSDRVGTLVCCYKESPPALPSEQVLLEAAAQRTATAIVIRALGDRQLFQLQDLVKLMERVADVDEATLLERLIHEVKTFFKADFCFVSTPNDEGVLHQFAKTWESSFNIPPIRVTGQRGDGITSYVAYTKQIYCCPDVEHDPYYKDVVAGDGAPVNIRSEMAGPLVFEGQLLGVIDLMSSTKSAFSNEHKTLLNMLLKYASIAFEHAQRARASKEIKDLTEDLHSRLLQLKASDQIYKALLDTAIASIQRLHPGTIIYGNLYVSQKKLKVSPKVAFFEEKAFVGTKSKDFSPTQYLGEGVVGRVASSGEPLIIADSSAPPPGIEYEPFISGITRGSEIAVPIKIGSEVDAVINLESPTTKLFCASDQKTLEALAAEISLAIRVAQLQESVLIDRRQAEAQRRLQFLLDTSHEVARAARSTNTVLLALEKTLTAQPRILKKVQEARRHAQQSIKRYDQLEERFNPVLYESANLIDALKAVLDKVSKTKKITIIQQLQISSFEVSGSMNTVITILDNLIQNAIEAMKGTGRKPRLVVSEHPVPDPDLFVLDIEDNGRGIPKDKQERIWEPYYSENARGKKKGLGLGLFLLRDPMEGCQIRLHHSEVEKGTTFRLTFSRHV